MSTMPASTCLTAVLVLLCSCLCHGFFIPQRRHRSYLQGEELHALVSPMTTLLNLLPIDYYSLPSCKPTTQVAGGMPIRSLGELLIPDGVQNSPYRFRVNVNESLYLCTTDPLTRRDLDLLLKRKFHHYVVNMVLDNLPLSSLDLDYSFKLMRGYFFSHMKVYPVDRIYFINHLKFRILLQESHDNSKKIDQGDTGLLASSTARYEIVGFEVFPCSVSRNSENMTKLYMYDTIEPSDCRWDLDAFMEARQGEKVTFTYQVEYVMSNISWSSRWDPYYLKVDRHGRLFSTLVSLGTILGLVLLFLVKFSRSIMRELTFYSASDSEGSLQLDEERVPKWKLIAGDVFWVPSFPKLLCVAVGTGVVIFLMALVCVFLAALGFIYPAPRGSLLTWILLFYLVFGIVGGFVGVWLWGSITGSYRGWRSVCFSIAAFFPGVVFFITGILNLVVYWYNGSSISGTTIACYSYILSLWACLLLPLTYYGGLLAAKRKPMQSPVDTSSIPRMIPTRQCRLWLFVFCFSFLPFSYILDELFLAFRSFCYGWYYSSPGLLLVAVLFFTSSCCLTSVISTYNHVHAGDWKWWWKSLFASGFTGVYVFLYAIKYLVVDLQGFVIETQTSITIYLGYSIIAALAMMLATGAVGFVTTFCFVRFLYASSKI